MAEGYPFSGMDMLQNSMSQLIGELRNVSSAIGQSARSLNSGIMQQAASIGGMADSLHTGALTASTRMMAPVPESANFFKETFSRQFNKPSLWSRDLAAMTGLRQYDDMYQHEVQRYARHNMGARAEKLGINALRAGSFVGTSLIKSTGIGLPVGIALDTTIGEWLKNTEQKQEWWGYLDKVGTNNAMLGRGAGVYGGWGDSQLKDMSKWLSTQDRAWYRADSDKMKQGELQSTIMSAEMQGYFHGTIDVSDFKQKVTKLVQDTKEIMKTMKMANDEAAALIGEMSYYGYKDSKKTIKEMNRTAAMTGLTFDEVKQYGMEYASQAYKAFGVDKDTSTDLVLKVLEKYDKKDQAGAQVELQGIYKAAADPTNQLLMTKYDPSTGRMVLDDKVNIEAINKMSSIERMNAAQKKMSQLAEATGGNFGSQLMDLRMRGSSMIMSADAETLRKFALGANMAPILTAVQSLADSNPNTALARAWAASNGDLETFLERAEPEDRDWLASFYSQTNPGTSMGDARKMLEAFTPGMGAQGRTGARTIDDVSSYWNVKTDKKKYEYGKGYTSPETQWSWMDTIDPQYSSYRWKNKMGANAQKENQLYRFAGEDVMTQILWMGVANDKAHGSAMEAMEDKLTEVTGWGGWNNGDSAHSLIYSMQAREVMTNADANAFQRAQMRDYYQRRGMSSAAAYEKASAFNIRDIQDMMLGKKTAMDAGTQSDWQAAYNRYRSGLAAYGGRGDNYARSLTDPQLLMEAQAFETAKRTDSGVKNIQAYLEGGGAWDQSMWSEELMEKNIQLLGVSKDKLMEPWQKSLVAGYEDRTKDLSKKAQKYFDTAVNATSYDKFLSNAKKFANESGNLSPNERMMQLSVMEYKNKGGYTLPDAGVFMNNALDSISKTSNQMAIIAGSQYSELFAGPTATNYLNQLADPNSVLAKRAKDPDGGAKEVADMIARNMALESKRSGRELTGREVEEVSELMQSSYLKDEKAQQQLAIEYNRQQGDMSSLMKNSNIYLGQIAVNTDAMKKIGDAYDGTALRVTNKIKAKSDSMATIN